MLHIVVRLALFVVGGPRGRVELRLEFGLERFRIAGCDLWDQAFWGFQREIYFEHVSESPGTVGVEGSKKEILVRCSEP